MDRSMRRERIRVRLINQSFHELSNMVETSQFDINGVRMEKSRTKMGVLNDAVELIKILEAQVSRQRLARKPA